ncbi:MAG: hypothetical protein A2542_02685 [Parcubacteria group bacterium RIFOXYD2_FULL_52_8]|nr:MAG: hypothetical protein A2542_02685 [Parcubacteria group bacterium RIFOXYD2_FULL_52_8]
MQVGEEIKLPDWKGKTTLVFSGSVQQMLEFMPRSTYNNDIFGDDKVNEQKAYLVTETGRYVAEVKMDWTSRYSDGGTGYGDGETIAHALGRLPNEDVTRIRYLIVEERRSEDNNRVVRKGPGFEDRGIKVQDDRSAKVYEI